jgi:hypothetical protein
MYIRTFLEDHLECTEGLVRAYVKPEAGEAKVVGGISKGFFIHPEKLAEPPKALA